MTESRRKDNTSRDKYFIEILKQGPISYTGFIQRLLAGNGDIKGLTDSALQKSASRFLRYFEAIGQARKNEKGMWEWIESAPKFQSEASYRLFAEHCKLIVGLGLGGILLPSSESTLTGRGFDDSVRTVMSELVGSPERGGIPTSNVSFTPSDHLDIQEFIFEDPLMGVMDDEGNAHLTREELNKINKEYGSAIDLAAFARQHIASGYPEILVTVERLDRCLVELNRLLAKVSQYVTVFVPPELGVMRKSRSGISEFDERMILIGFRRGETPDLKKYEYMRHVRLIPNFPLGRRTVSIAEDHKEEGSEDYSEDLDAKTPKAYQKLAEQLDNALRERRDVIESLIKEYSLLRLKVRSGSILRGKCKICPDVEILSWK